MGKLSEHNIGGTEATHGDILREVKELKAEVSRLVGYLAMIAVIVGLGILSYSLHQVVRG